MANQRFWQGKKVFITGHTGFKGTWLCLLLHQLGADVTGYALTPPTSPNLFDGCKINGFVRSTIADIRDGDLLQAAIARVQPDIVFHLAAQPLVRDSYKKPVETYQVNVMGTVNLFEAVRCCQSVRAIVNVTTDKCYENKEWVWGYRENEPLGGYDPYSSSKACSEIVTAAYRNSYFPAAQYEQHKVAIATARAGNVIGGGDWANDRLIPDCVRALGRGEPILVRNPKAVRPWQHVLEPLNGYLMLAQRLFEQGPSYGEPWNFGPVAEDAWAVGEVVRHLCTTWGDRAEFRIESNEHQPHEAIYLQLDCSKTGRLLNWHPRWRTDLAIEKVVEWSKAYFAGCDTLEICCQQISEYESHK